ncbi:conserved hypothetical protein, partial [Trichinella spiralis]|uniref:hypothetical protein n=1 Tax=Trichinella spiralis TaxID=6334 RepID=UPI0001EFDC30
GDCLTMVAALIMDGFDLERGRNHWEGGDLSDDEGDFRGSIVPLNAGGPCVIKVTDDDLWQYMVCEMNSGPMAIVLSSFVKISNSSSLKLSKQTD